MNENDNENENCPSDGIASRFTLLASRSFPPPRGSWKGLFTLHSPVRFSMICLFEGISLQFVVHRIADRFQPLIACSLLYVLVISEVLEP